MEHRIIRINGHIQELMSSLIERELSLKNGVLVTVSRVDTSKDLRYTRIFVSVFPEMETDYALKTLEKERKGLQKELHRKLSMKPLPKIAFFLDMTGRGADVIEKLLIKIKKENET